MKVLIVDDDIHTLEIVRDSINWKSYGIHITQTANNIDVAKKLICENKHEIVICDIEMPMGSGLELIKWVRENNYDCEFIFFTCYEKFEFASTAINYSAVAYITKPFEKNKLESAILKALNSVAKNKSLKEHNEYMKYWTDNKHIIEQSFWYDILFHNITPRIDFIKMELDKRHLSKNMIHNYYIVLSSINKFQTENMQWEDSIFKFAICKLSSEVLINEIDITHSFCYLKDETYYNVTIVDCNISMDEIVARCWELIKLSKDFFQCQLTCYISTAATIENLAKVRENLENLDKNNIISRGKVILQSDYHNFENNTKEQYIIDINLIYELFIRGEKVQIVNILKKQIETLSAEKKINYLVLQSIRQDFMQIVYTVLYKYEIQAHKLFSDEISQKMFKSSEFSVFDMMKWITFITNKTIDYINEVQNSESIIEKVKRFIQENYNKDISREDIASYVFLTPDYLSKLFKAKTGIYIKDYINTIRIEKAKELLIKSNLSMSDIASETGFENSSYFSTVFKKITGESPITFRRIYKKVL